MDWIKRRWDQFALLVCALLLLALSGLLISKAMGFGEVFDRLKGNVAKSTEVEPVDTSVLEAARQQIKEPPQWVLGDKAGSLFVGQQYIVVPDPATGSQKLISPTDPDSPPIYEPIPNDWFSKNDLPILETDVLTQDPDGDKFTNLEEWEGKSDPNNPESHPPFWQKLRLKSFEQTKFRVLFPAYQGDPLDPSSLTFQINTLDVNQPTQFLKLGDPIEGTKFVITGFEYKTITDANGVRKDLSELTVQNSESKDKVKLVIEQIMNSPDSFAVFKYLIDDSEMKVKLGKTFALPPDGTEYKVVDINSDRAVIEDAKTGEKHEIPKLEQ